MSGPGLLLRTLADAKGLPVAHLEARGWREVRARGVAGPCVGIPWPKMAGPDLAIPWHVRCRIERDGFGPRWLWDLPTGVDLNIYGSDRTPFWLEQSKARGKEPGALIVESEADAEVCAVHDVPALATAGARFWKPRWAGTALAFANIYIVEEPDASSGVGALVIARDILAEASQQGVVVNVGVVRFPSDAKDPGQLHLSVGKDRGTFRKALGGLLAQSIPAGVLLEENAARLPTGKTFARRGDAAPPSWLDLVYRTILDFLATNGYDPRQTSDGGVIARCPLHHERHGKSLSVHPSRGWYCFSPKACGNGRLTLLALRLGVAVADERTVA